MPESSTGRYLKEDITSFDRDVNEFRKTIHILLSKWYYILSGLLVALLCAFICIRISIPIYHVSATLLINENDRNILKDNNQLFQGFKTGSGLANLDNQIMQLTSRTLTEKTLEELQYRIEFYQKGLIRKETLYPFSLIKIIPENPDSLLNDTEFRFKYIDKNSFHLRITSNDTVKLNSKFRFGENINIAGGNFIIQLNTNNTKNDKDLKKLYFIVHSNDKLVESFKSRLKVQAVSKNSTAVDLSIEGSNYLMDTEYLNKLIEIFINNSLAKKNLEAIRTISFIDDQLIGISDSLLITEKKLQEFRSKNRVMNLSSQGQAIIDQAMNLENEKARIEVEANYYDYLADYLIKDNTGEVPIAPATIGITDPGLTKLVADLADLQGQLYGKSLGEKNPLRNQLLVRIRNTKEALKETLNGVRRANNLAKNENLSQIRTINAQATALPVTERQLLGIERKF